jgi:hypothetical protein
MKGKEEIMNSYIFRLGCWPRGDLRVEEILEFLHLAKEAFRCPALYDDKDTGVTLTESGLLKIFQKEYDPRFPGLGVIVHFFTIPPGRRDDDTVRIEIHTGTHPSKKFIDTFNISMDDSRKVPSMDYFERFIEIFKPFEAFLGVGPNEAAFDTYNRQQAIPKFDRPAIIRGFHYLDATMAQSIGGIKYCLKAPAWHVERFCEGVLIELVPELFDSYNTEHLRVQKEVLDYFHIM